MRIAFVTQWFPPERGALVAESIATGLADLGHDVDVMTAFPNYPTGVIYHGWAQRPYLREALTDRVTVHRTPVYPSHDSHALRRMASYLSYAASATTISANRIPRPDAWLVYSSPATAALPAQLARPGRRVPTCLLIQDLWPDSVSDSGMMDGTLAKITNRGLAWYTKASYRHASRIGVISPGMVKVLTDRGVPRNKVEWTPNWLQDEPILNGSDRASLGLPVEGRLFLYAGNLGGLQGLDHLVGAFALVPSVSLVLLGDGVERKRLSKLASTIPNVHVLPPVSQSVVANYLAAADVLVVSLQDTPLLRVTMPSKVQAYLRAGKPLLAHTAGDAALVVRVSGAGVVADPKDQQATVAAVIRLAIASEAELVAMGVAARKYFDRNFTREAGARRLETMLVNATKDRRP